MQSQVYLTKLTSFVVFTFFNSFHFQVVLYGVFFVFEENLLLYVYIYILEMYQTQIHCFKYDVLCFNLHYLNYEAAMSRDHSNAHTVFIFEKI